MASYPLTLPTSPGIRDIEWIPQSAVATSRSILTQLSQTYDWQGKTWRVTIELPPMSLADAKDWQAWIYEMNGVEGTFWLSDTIGGPGRGTVAGTPLVATGGQTGQSLDTDGWSNGDNVKAGDWISIYGRLYQILEDATETGGLITLTVWPNLAAPDANAPILYGSAAKGIFRLAEFPAFAWGTHHQQEPITMVAVEAKLWGAIHALNGDMILALDDTAILQN